MILKNKLSLEKVALHVPPLPPEYQGISGAMLQAFTFDESVGKEVCAVFFDDPEFSRELSALKPFGLSAATGFRPTTAGAIGYIIWSMSGESEHKADYEYMLNPFEQVTFDLLNAVAKQRHIKAIVIDSSSGEVVGFYELENDFDFDGFAEILATVADKWPEANFALTREALRLEYSIMDLKTGRR